MGDIKNVSIEKSFLEDKKLFFLVTMFCNSWEEEH